MVIGRKIKILTAFGVMVLAISACSLIPVSALPTAEATALATVVLPLATLEVRATEVAVATPSAEVLTPTATQTAVDLPIVFPEGFRNQGDGITFQVSEGARAVGEILYGGPIESFGIDSDALTRLRTDLIGVFREVYVDHEHIQWNDRVEFLIPIESEISWNGSQFVINSDPGNHWDIHEPLNIFAVTSQELDAIKDRLIANDPEAKYTLTYPPHMNAAVLIFTNRINGETNVYTSIDGLASLDLSDLSVTRRLAGAFVNFPLGGFRSVISGVAINIGKRADIVEYYEWMYEDLGCGVDWLDACSAVTIR